MLQVLVTISQKFCCRKEAWGYAKVIHKKRERKVIHEKKRVEKKIDKCLRYLKQWVLRFLPRKKREMNKIAPALWQVFPSFKREISFQGAK